MITNEEATHAIIAIIDRIRSEMDLEMEITTDLVIIGESSLFDSMAFLDLIAGIEEWMDEKYELYISLAGDDEDFSPDGPFGRVDRLAQYVTDLVKKERVDP